MSQHVGTNFSIEQQLEQLSAIQSVPDFSNICDHNKEK